jgi:hypothetical protein
MDTIFKETFHNVDIDEKELEKLLQVIEVHGYRGQAKNATMVSCPFAHMM